MRKRTKMALAVLFVAAVGFAAWEGLREREKEPIYNNKPLGYWVSTTPKPRMLNGRPRPPEVPAFDARAVPFLIKYAQKHDGPFLRLYFAARSKLPAALQARLPAPAPAVYVQFTAIGFLKQLGPDAKPAIPALIRIFREEKDGWIQRQAAACLKQFEREDERVRTAFIEALAGKDDLARVYAAAALFQAGFKDHGEENLLRQSLTNRDLYVRSEATNMVLNVAPAMIDSTPAIGTYYLGF